MFSVYLNRHVFPMFDACIFMYDMAVKIGQKLIIEKR